MAKGRFWGTALVAALVTVTSIQAAEIHDAVQAGDLAKVTALIEKDPGQINAKDETGKTALHWAARGTNLPVLQFLVERGADVDALDANGIAPLHSLASRGNSEGILLLLAKGADINIKTPDKKTPLHFAALGRNPGILGPLVEHKADLESRDDWGRTPLIVAAREMSGPEVVGRLLELGAKTDALDRFGDNALSLAAWRGSVDVVNLLLARGVDIRVGSSKGRELLENAVSKGMTDLFLRMVKKGVDLDPTTDTGGTLLSAAAEGGSIPIIETLLTRGFAVNHPDENGWTPLHFAADMGNLKAIELLLAKGANLESRTVMGQSAYNLAEDNQDKDTMGLLTAKGAETTPPAFPVLTGAYLGQKPPGKKASLFAPGIVSGRYGLHSNVVFSPDGKEAFWSLMLPSRVNQYGGGRTVVSRLVDGRWTYPQEAVFEGTKLDDVPFFGPDGVTLYDMAQRPRPGEKETGKENIWIFSKGSNGWGNPQPLDPVVNSLPHHWQFSLDQGGNLYFSSNIPGSKGGHDIYISRRANGRYQKPENLGEAINTTEGEDFPYITPDGRTLLFGRNMDIYASFRTPAGGWTKARALGNEVNTRDMEVLPILSPDGKYLFFSRGQKSWWIGAGLVEDLRAVELDRVGKKSAAEEMDRILREGDIEKAKDLLATIRKEKTSPFFIDEAEFNDLGYRFLGQGKASEAVAVFEMNSQAFPGSWNAWDSLGEACAEAGDRQQAIQHYTKSLELNPKNQNGKDAISRLKGYELDEAGETSEPLRFQPGTTTGLRGPYLGQTPPGAKPAAFAPGIVSSAGAFEFSIAISPKGDEIYFTRRLGGGANSLMVTRQQSDGWSAPVETSFAKGFPANEPHITPDGRRLYFGTWRPLPGAERADFGIWVVERGDSGAWGDPRYHGPGMYVSAAKSGNLYMTDITRLAGGGVIVYPWSEGQFGPPQRLGGGVNAPKGADHAFIAPDESYILFDSYFRPGGQGGEGDLWVSFPKPDGTWSEAQNLGDAINTPGTNFCPMVSPDGRYIFYSTNKDIYWVSSQVLEELRNRAFPTETSPPRK